VAALRRPPEGIEAEIASFSDYEAFLSAPVRFAQGKNRGGHAANGCASRMEAATVFAAYIRSSGPVRKPRDRGAIGYLLRSLGTDQPSLPAHWHDALQTVNVSENSRRGVIRAGCGTIGSTHGQRGGRSESKLVLTSARLFTPATSQNVIAEIKGREEA